MITTVVGNYPKVPSLTGGPNLRTAINRFDQGRISAEELAKTADEATKDAMEEQARAGLDVISDGQIRWEDEVTYFARDLSGITLTGLIRWFDTNTYYRRPLVTGPVRWTGPVTVKDYQFAAGSASKPLKAVLPGPFTLAAHVENKHYGDQRKLALSFAEALNAEALALQEAGADFIQFNDPSLLPMRHLFPLYEEAVGVALHGVSARTALYTYFGDIDGLYPELFELPFQVFGLDFIMGEANLNLLKTFPTDKELGAGLIDARNTRLEPVEDLVAQLDQIRRVVPLDRVHLSPSCGLEFLPRKNAFEKLARMAAAAERAEEVLA